MERLTAILATNEEGVIGAKNRLPWRVKSDLRFFREMTLGNVVLMGRKTHDSLGGCLKDRLNVVVTHGFRMFANSPDCLSAGSIVEALAQAESKRKRRQEVLVIGGGSMYLQFAPYVDRYLITEIKKPVDDGDTWFDPNILGDLSNWTRRVILEGDANDAGDEAPFKIYELTSKHSAAIKRARDEAISRIFEKSRRSPANRFAVGEARAVA